MLPSDIKVYKNKRSVVLDTETTGLDPYSGHKIVEIGCVELINNIPTGKTYQTYINPERNMPREAYNVHGISAEFLSNKPIFEKITDSFLEFIKNATLIIHNASFDLKFLNYELQMLSKPIIRPRDEIKNLEISKSAKSFEADIVDTLKVARSMFPGSPNNLDALCRRLKVDNTMRDKHGALMDADLLARVYLAMLGGRQKNIDFDNSALKSNATKESENSNFDSNLEKNQLHHKAPYNKNLVKLSEDEKELHNVSMKKILL